MLAHNIKEVLTMLPEAMPLVKQASLEEDFPTNNKDSVCASYLTAKYLTKVAGKAIDLSITAKLEKAASLYGIREELELLASKLSKPITKKASRSATLVKEAEAMFEGDLSGFLDITKAATKAEALMTKYAAEVTSTEVLVYSGNAYLKKEAAITSLANRYYATKGKVEEFAKIASLIHSTSVHENDFDAVKSICKAVTLLDKQAGLDLIGFNFYKEALTTKVAAVNVNVTLNGQQVPYDKIARVGKATIGSYLGKDIEEAFTGDAFNDKAVLEALPRDSQAMLISILRNVK